MDWRLGAHDGRENAGLADMLGSLFRGEILVPDRLFPGRESLADLHRVGVDYVMRVKTSGARIAKETPAFVASRLNE